MQSYATIYRASAWGVSQFLLQSQSPYRQYTPMACSPKIYRIFNSCFQNNKIIPDHVQSIINSHQVITALIYSNKTCQIVGFTAKVIRVRVHNAMLINVVLATSQNQYGINALAGENFQYKF